MSTPARWKPTNTQKSILLYALNRHADSEGRISLPMAAVTRPTINALDKAGMIRMEHVLPKGRRENRIAGALVYARHALDNLTMNVANYQIAYENLREAMLMKHASEATAWYYTPEALALALELRKKAE